MTVSTLFPLVDVECRRVLARAHDGAVAFELLCRREPDHDGQCRALGWTEATR